MLGPVLASLALGALHAVGPDHCAAMAALAARERSSRGALRLAARFALGHTVVLGVGWVILQVAGHLWPAWLDRAGELAGGAALVVLGLPLLLEGLLSRLGLHAHHHAHAGMQHVHPHFHHRAPGHVHRHLSAIWTGALFAAGGLRSLLVALPAASARGVASGLALFAFAAGLFSAMSLYGLALGRALPALDRVGGARWAGRALGAASIAVGCWYIAGS